MIPNFAIDQNLKVEFLVPDSAGTSFLLGISLLGGTDTLGGVGEFTLGVSLIGSPSNWPPPATTVRTNLARNPNFETNTTTWQFITRVSTSPQSGSWCGQINLFDEDSGLWVAAMYPTGSTVIGQTYRVGMYVRVSSGSHQFNMQLNFGGSFIATSYTVGTSWQFIESAPIVASNTSPTIIIESAAPNDGTLSFIDSAILELSSTYNSTYFDGNTTDTASTDYAWTGTANASTSTATTTVPWPATPDVLAPSSGLKWQEVTCETAQASISVGGSLQDSVYFQPEPATCNLTLQSYELDPTVNQNIRASTKFRVRLASDEIDRILFQGFIDTIDVTYYPQGPNVIQITGFDAYKSLVNSRFATWDTTPYGAHIHVDETWELIGSKSGLGLSPESYHVAGTLPVLNETNIEVSSLVNDALTVGNGLVWLDQDTEELVVIHRTFDQTGTPTTPIIGNNHGDPYHLCMSEINVFSDADAVYNSLTVSLTSNPAITTFRKDQDSIDLYGESAINIEINTTSLGQLNNWADRVFNHRSANTVNQVSTPSIDRLGTLTNAAVFTPGMTVGVSYTNTQLDIVGYYTIIKVSHRIDPDNWFTTLELWKEA
jgi:hypothetical protein